MATIKHNGFWFDDDKKIDYSTEIEKAVNAGDYRTAAYLEKSRNAKIDYYGMPYETTNKYSAYLEPAQPKSVAKGEPKSYFADGMNAAFRNIQNQKFSYDPESDALYKSVKDNYKKTADAVIENAMGSYAGMTGGVPSSYAVSAAAQAGAQHLQKADDMIPELYQLAYNKFADDKADLYKQFSIMQGLEEQAYNRELTERNWQYQLDRDAVADEQYADELARTDAKDAKSTANAQITNSLLMGVPPSDELIAASGAYAPGTTGQMILDTFQKDEKKQEAAERVSNAFLMGVPPKEEDLALLNYPEGITGEAALAAYKAANAPKVTGSLEGSIKAKELKRPTTAMFDAIDKLFEEGEGAAGLSKLLSKYDWRIYDRGVIDEYISDNYGDEAGVLEYKYGDDIEGVNVDKWIDYINEALYDAWVSSGKKGGNSRTASNESRKPHIYADEGSYRLAGDVTPTDVVEILFNSSLTDGQISYILESLGITEDEVDL